MRLRRRARISTGLRIQRGCDDVPDELRAAAVLVDGGDLPGQPSTVVDLTGREPLVLREGAVPAAEALARVEAVAAGSGPGSSIGADGGRAAHVRGPAGRDAHRRRPRDRRSARPGARARARRDRADRVRELHVAGDARGGRQRPHEQVLRGVPGPPLLRRLRDRRRDRAAGDRPRPGSLRRAARERPAARRRTDEHGRLLRLPPAGRHDPLALALTRRPPHPRAQGQLLRPSLRHPALRRLPRDERRRLRRRAPTREGAPAEADRVRRVGISADRRDAEVPGDRGRGRRAPALRHGALRRARRRGNPSEPRRRLRLRHLDHAQDARRAAVRVHPLSGGACAGRRSRGVPRDAGRPAQPRHRRQGDVLPDRRVRALPAVPAAGQAERGRALRRAPGRRSRGTHGRYRHAPPAHRPSPLRMEREGRRGAARRGRRHGEPQHHPVRRAAADDRVGRPARNARGDDARVRRGRHPRGGADHRGRARSGRGPRSAGREERGALRAASAVSGAWPPSRPSAERAPRG